MAEGLPLPYTISDRDDIQGNFDALKKQFPLSRKSMKLEERHVVGAADEPAFQNSWVNYDTATFQGASFWVDANDIVHLEGSIKNGTIGAGGTAFVLPTGYRPANAVQFGVISNNAIGRVDITPTGNVIPQFGSNVIFSLSGISFRRAT